MEGPRGTRKDEVKDTIKLINYVFRIIEGHKPTISEEFPLLLCEKNADNMRIFKDKNKIVSAVNFLNQNISIEGSIIKTASIGAVCTHPDYRKKKLASMLLNDVEDKMFKDGVDVCLISGDKSIYTRRKAMVLNCFKYYEIFPKQVNLEVKIDEYTDKDLQEVVALYNMVSTRYERTYDTFKTIIHSATIPWGNLTYKKYVFKNKNEIIGYLILRIINDNKKCGQVVECFGSPQLIFNVLEKLAFDLKLEKITYCVHIKDKIDSLDNYADWELSRILGTIKIINFEQFMSHLYKYFVQYIPKEFVDKLKFQENDGYKFIFEDEILKIDDLGILTKLIFEVGGINLVNLEDKPNISKFIEKVFPIPFVSPGNLNFT